MLYDLHERGEGYRYLNNSMIVYSIHENFLFYYLESFEKVFLQFWDTCYIGDSIPDQFHSSFVEINKLNSSYNNNTIVFFHVLDANPNPEKTPTYIQDGAKCFYGNYIYARPRFKMNKATTEE